jgi:hypothetical protein
LLATSPYHRSAICAASSIAAIIAAGLAIHWPAMS